MSEQPIASKNIAKIQLEILFIMIKPNHIQGLLCKATIQSHFDHDLSTRSPNLSYKSSKKFQTITRCIMFLIVN